MHAKRQTHLNRPDFKLSSKHCSVSKKTGGLIISKVGYKFSYQKAKKKILFCTKLIQGSIKIRSAGSGLDPRPLGGGRGLFASGTLILFVCSSGGSVARRLLLHVPRHRGNPIDKLGLEEDVGIVEHPILQRHHDKLEAEKERDGIRTGWVRCQFYC